jgi:hypothetical protein
MSTKQYVFGSQYWHSLSSVAAHGNALRHSMTSSQRMHKRAGLVAEDLFIMVCIARPNIAGLRGLS